MSAFPSGYTPNALLELPVRELASLFWMSFVQTEERTRRELEGHAYTAWWVYRSIDFGPSHPRTDWAEWRAERGLTWDVEESKSKAELVEEAKRKFDAVWDPNMRFKPMT